MSGDQSVENDTKKAQSEEKAEIKKRKEETVAMNKVLSLQLEALSQDITQKDSFVQEIKGFLKSDEIMMLVQ